MDVLLVFAAALLTLELAEAYFRRFTSDGLHFQNCTSEYLMQSVSVRDLASAPFDSIWYLHIQPPISNLIRGILAAFHRHVHGLDLIQQVDRDLFHVWALVAAALAALIYRWLSALRLPGWLAALLTIGWFIHPANIAYATLMDGTFLSGALTTWIVYATWRIGYACHRSSVELAVVVLLAYFTRSLFQWPFVLVMIGSLLLLRLPRRQIVVFAASVGIVVSLYSLKQAWLFGTTSTSSFEGTNLSHSIGANCDHAAPIAPTRLTAARPEVLINPTKLDGSVNFNSIEHLAIERGLLACYRHELTTRSLRSLLTIYWDNLRIYLRPTSRYWTNDIVDRLPWREAYDYIFSANLLLWAVIIAASLAAIRTRRKWRAALAVALPVIYVFLVSVLGERGENMRFKFFLEPTLYVLITSEAYHTGSHVVAVIARRIRARIASSPRRSVGRVGQ